MPIHLHIGTHKTGTTAIQRQLRRNRDGLKSRGIWYPSEAELLPGGQAGITPHRKIAISLDNTKGKKPYSYDALRVIAKAILKGAQQYEHTILSSEAFWRIGFAARPEHYSVDELWLRKASNVAKVRRLFGDADVRIIAVLRERSAYIQSGYSEFLLATLYTKDIASYLNSYTHSWDYSKQLQTWGELFPVQAHSYEELCRDQQLPLNFLKQICGTNLPAETLLPDPKPRVNISDPLACVAFKRFLNQLPLNFDTRIKIYQEYNQIFQKAANRPNPGPQVRNLRTINSWLNSKELMKLQDSLAPGDLEIRNRFCSGLVSCASSRRNPYHVKDTDLRAMTSGDQREVIDWMLNRKPLKPTWFQSALEDEPC